MAAVAEKYELGIYYAEKEFENQDGSVNKQKSATTTVTQPSLAGAKKGTKQVHNIECLNTTTTTQFLKAD
ncbi:hypothetical protein CFP56_030532 [Quercus suber]|uniref:Uncharacterized protein n=1 Tax=Quercus suber TaxID=58331 RepID=A0AAW0JNN8_QUESU